MGETQRGGYYFDRYGRAFDANGNKIEKPRSEGGQKPADILGGLPDRVKHVLKQNNFYDPEVLSKLTDEELDAIDGLGPSSVTAIREALK